MTSLHEHWLRGQGQRKVKFKTLNYPTRNAQDYSINKSKKMFSDCAIKNCGPTFWNSLDKTLEHCKTTKHFRNQLKSILLSEYN